jgi:ribosomal protein S18 acetylase RimI-like enzyme
VIAARSATLDDVPAVVALLARDELGQHREDASLPLRAEYVRAFAAMERQLDDRVLLAVDGEDVVGCLQLTLLPGLSRLGALRAQIEGVRVSASHRRRGVGARLMAEAIAFYERLGFEASHVGLKLRLR